MSNDTYFLEVLAKERQRGFEREAELRRLRLAARKTGPGVWAGLWIRVGDFLIRQGQAMKHRYGAGPCLAGCYEPEKR